MATSKYSYGIFFVLASSLMISACSRVIIPGMPNFDSRYTPQLSRPKPGRDYKLVNISYQVTAKQKKYIPSKKTKYSSRKRFVRSKGRAAGIGGYKYIIGSRDILNVTVWDHPELTIPAGEVRSAQAAGHTVDNAGFFFFPYAGMVKAAGRTTEQVRQDLAQTLAQYITNPQVGISIAAYRSQKVYITGAVNKPGIYAITDSPLAIRDALGKTEGLTEKAVGFALLNHHGRKITIDLDALFNKGDITQNYILRGGDSLHIYEEEDENPKEFNDKYDEKVFVMGEVKKAGSVSMLDGVGLTLAEALSEAGSINEVTANPTGIFVVRKENRNDKIPTVYQLAMTSVHSVALAQEFSLRPKDVVYVTAAPLTRWHRIVSQLLPSLSALSTTSRIGN